jgi:hypothetical protein
MNGIRSALSSAALNTTFLKAGLLRLASVVVTALLVGSQTNAAEIEESLVAITQVRRDPATTMGVLRGDCKKCHPSEVASWMKMTHFQSADLRLFSFTGNTKKYAEALNISSSDLLKNSMCADCHGTKAAIASEVSVIGGVSCESCHGASGGPDGWLNRHQSYHDAQPVPRQLETPEHKLQRQTAVDKAGMIRSENIYDQARACLQCHVISNEDLIAAGHKSSSAAFEYSSWTEGETRHNFLLDRTTNAAAPSIWLEGNSGKVAERKRMKFVLGKLAQLEMALRARAAAKNPATFAQFGGSFSAIVYGNMSVFVAAAPESQLPALNAKLLPLAGTFFVPMPNDAELYGKAADDVAAAAKAFAAENDGSKLAALDGQITVLQPYFSQNFKTRFLGTP